MRPPAPYMDDGLRGPVALCRLLLRQRVRPGDRVVDATCGNGRDTRLLAELVGPEGRVWAFDIQEEALAAARVSLAELPSPSPVELILAGHELLDRYVTGRIRAAVFNLGYLPGGNRATATSQGTTLAALDQASRLLMPGGIIPVVVYTRHGGGAEEGRAVEEWAAGLPSPEFNVWAGRMLNRRGDAPYLLLIEKGTSP